LYSSLNFSGDKIKANEVGGGLLVAGIGRTEMHTGFWWRNLNGRNNFENVAVDGRIMSE